MSLSNDPQNTDRNPQRTRAVQTVSLPPLSVEDKRYIYKKLMHSIAGGSKTDPALIENESLTRTKEKLAAEISYSSNGIDGYDASLNRDVERLLKQCNLQDKLPASSKEEKADRAKRLFQVIICIVEASDIKKIRKDQKHLAKMLGDNITANDLKKIITYIPGVGVDLEEIRCSPPIASILPPLWMKEVFPKYRSYQTIEEKSFDFQTKTTWRNKVWGGFVDRAISSPFGSDIVASPWICFPGISPEAEMRLYLEKQFEPKLAYPFEGGSKQMRTSFEKELEILRLDYPRLNRGTTGRLEDYLNYGSYKNLRPGLVALDYEGHVTDEQLYTLRNLALAEDSVVMLNAMAMREGDSGKRIVIKSYQDLGRVNSLNAALVEGYNEITNEIETSPKLNEENKKKLKKKRGEILQEAREVAWDYLTFSQIGLARASNRREHHVPLENLRKLYQKMIPGERAPEGDRLWEDGKYPVYTLFQRFEKGNREIAEYIFKKILYQCTFEDPTLTQHFNMPQASEELVRLASDICFGRPQVLGFEKWRYNSDSSKRSVFISWLAHLHRSDTHYKKWDNTARFLLNLNYNRHLYWGGKIRITGPDFRIRERGHRRISNKDHICMFTPNGKPLANTSLPIKILMNDLKNYVQWKKSLNLIVQDRTDIRYLTRQLVT